MTSLDHENTSQSDFYQGRAKEFVELHDQVQTSVNLLDSLESFLSTFQKDLDAVAGQISELQDRSKDIEGRLKSRRRIERPLSSLLSDITIAPSLAVTILDTNVGEPWIEAIEQFEKRLITSKSRTRVKAARDLGEVAEGLRIVAATKLRGFFLALFQPIRSSVTTNMQVIQTSVLLKYSSLFGFLQRQAPAVANELQRAYVGAARLYYETGFRRYARSLSYIKARTPEKFEPIASIDERESEMNLQRLQHAKIDGPSATMSFLADGKTYKEPVEALLRSLLLVFMDNATAEYTFISQFFASNQPSSTVDTSLSLLTPVASVPTPTMMATPDTAVFIENRSPVTSEYEGSSRQVSGFMPGLGGVIPLVNSKEEQALVDAIWKQIMDPVVDYSQNFVKTILEPIPPAIPLLTMIRLIEELVTEIQKRRCPPAENFIFGIRIQMWPAFQKAMHEHIESMKKLAEGGVSYGYFSRAVPVTDATVAKVARHYINFFNSFVYLTEHEEETMIFSNLQRLRDELVKLINKHTERITDVVAKATAQSALYEVILQQLSKGTQHTAHLRLQKEIAYWAYQDEEAKRKIVSVDLAHQQAANLVPNHHHRLAHFIPTTPMAPANGSDASRGKQVPVSIPPMTAEEEDSIILARITNDERPLKRVIKKFHAYASLAAPPIVPPSTSAAGKTTLEDAKEAFLVELRAYQLALKKSAMICDAETRQVEEYQREKERIDEEHVTLREQIEELKVALEHAQMLRRRKIEYDQVTEKVNSLPSREELELSIAELDNDMAAIRVEHDAQNRVLLAQKSALDIIVTDLAGLRFIGKDKETMTPSISARATPLPDADSSGQYLAVESSTRGVSSALSQADESTNEDEKEEGEDDGEGNGSSRMTDDGELDEGDIEMGEVEEEPRNKKLTKAAEEELEEGEASDFSSELSDPPDD